MQSQPALNRRQRRRLGKPVAVLLAGLVLASSVGTFDVLQQPTAAHAISEGAGVNTMGGFIGGFQHSNGQIVFCVEMGRPPQMGINPALGATSALPAYTATEFHSGVGNWTNIQAPALSGAGLKTMNKVMSKYGQTANANQAAAVQIAIWELRAAGANASYQSMLSAMKGAVDPSIVANAMAMIKEAQASDAAENAPGDPRIFGTGSYKGHVVVDPGTTELTITNGIFDATGSSKITFPGGTKAVQTVAWTGQAPYDDANWGRYYRVTVNGKYEYQSSPAEVSFGHPGGYGQGIAAGTASKPVTGNYKAVGIDPDTLWSPVLTTETPSKFVKRGESFSDTITFGVAEGSNPWRQSLTSAGESRFAPIKAEGTLYGPFLQDPALNPSATPPKGSPVAAAATVTTDSKKGPGTYNVDKVGKSEEAGYYSWVWKIQGSDQLASVVSPPNGLDGSLPKDYFFTDGFGQASEGQLTPTELRWSTKVAKKQVPIGGKVTDDVDVTLQNGGWLQNAEGNRTPFTLRGTVYLANKKPVQQPVAPEGAQVLTTTKQTVDSVAKFTSKDIKVPLNTKAKYATVQWCLVDEDQTDDAKGKAEEWCDDYGVPSETFKIVGPAVETQAIEKGSVAGTIHDIATVTGGLPENAKTEIEFELFLKPEAGQPKYDKNWKPILDENGDPVLWSEDEVADPAAVCEAQPVAKTDRVEVTKLGEVKSPDVFTHSTGTGYWVESTIITPNDPEDGEEFEYSRGRCGIPNETTVIEGPEVETQAIEKGEVAGTIHDVAGVTGTLPNASKTEIEFELFLKPEAGQPKYDENWEAIVDENGKVVLWTEDEVKDPEAVCEAQPVAKTDRVEVTELGEVKSPDVFTHSAGTSYWVESTIITPDDPKNGEEFEYSRGRCGIPNETTVIEEPKVRTEGKTVTVGDEIWDTAFTSEHGDLSELKGVEYKVTFKAYTREDGKDMVCSPENEIKDFEDKTGGVVTEPGKYESNKVKTTEKHIGLGGYQETLIRVDKGTEIEVAVGKCGEPSENLEVRKKPVVPGPLASTGGNVALLAGLSGGVLLLGAAAVLAAKRHGRAAGAEKEIATN
ncbi:hypothetical protein [Leucobacter aridicollis]|uniref:hypothetical protein n=1 Tax=Leucobacter aridicollis TaxID=283878 RepID=UPI0037C958E8